MSTWLRWVCAGLVVVVFAAGVVRVQREVSACEARGGHWRVKLVRCDEP